MSKTKIDLGCGIHRTEGFIGVDCVNLPGIDIIHDLNMFPYPFDDNSIDEIVMNSVLQYLDNIGKVFEEIYRILKPGGILKFTVPYSGHQTSGSIGQRQRFLSRDFYYLEKENTMHYRIFNKVDFKVLRVRYIFSTKEINKTSLWGPIYFLIGTIIQGLLNSSFKIREGYELCWGFIFPLREFEIISEKR